MVHLRHTLLLTGLVASGVGLATPALAASGGQVSGIEDRLRNLEDELARNVATIDLVEENLKSHSGLMSADDAQKRYEEAVFTSLMGDYEVAALEFTILVESGSALPFSIKADAEWYLGETLFELANYTLAEEVYRKIVERGPEHPFFSDAVRRLLELYGITGQTKQFETYYGRYIATKKVNPSELINYTLAKSFYRQGGEDSEAQALNWVKAKSLFSDFAADSVYYARARYFLGTILVRQGKLEDAASEFGLAAATPTNDPEAREVVDLANLALGRVYYELGKYRESATAYQKIGRESKYFAEQLYELVWTFIKQQEYEEAIRAIEIFLLAFPEHKYAAHLKVYKGHLQMKQERFESANSTYDKVISEYSPIRDLVAAVEVSREQPRIFFERLVNEDALEILNRAGLPPFAAEMLYDEQNVRKTVDLRRELEDQKLELQRSATFMDELEAALVGGVSSLGSFKNAREDIQWITKERVEGLDRLLDLEEEFLLANTSGSVKSRVQRIKQERKAVSDMAADLLKQQLDYTDKNAIFIEQIRAVQTQAFLVEQLARECQNDVRATRDYMELGKNRLAPDEMARVRADLDGLEAGLSQAIETLRPLQAENALRQVMGMGERVDLVEETGGSRQLINDYRELHSKYSAMRSQVSAAGAREFFLRDRKSVV